MRGHYNFLFVLYCIVLYGTSCSQGISQFYLHTQPQVQSAIGMRHTCLCLPSYSWLLIYRPEGMKGWVGLGGWLRSETVFEVACSFIGQLIRAFRFLLSVFSM